MWESGKRWEKGGRTKDFDMKQTRKNLEQYTFCLEKYHGAYSRHECPQCHDRRSLTWYVDEQGQPIDKTVGKCNHVNGCGYHYTPKQFFADNGIAMPGNGSSTWRRTDTQRRMYASRTRQSQKPPTTIDTLPKEYVIRSRSTQSTLMDALIDRLPLQPLGEAWARYALGATKDRRTIFWQIDIEGRVRAGKIMAYTDDGHRAHDRGMDWVHSKLKREGKLPPEWTLRQCWFGLHLLRPAFGNEGKPVAIVESEKTAFIGSTLMPEFVWLATGGCGNLRADDFEAVRGRDVVVYPDTGSFDKWKSIAASVRCCRVVVSDLLENKGFPANTDLADALLGEAIPTPTLETRTTTEAHFHADTTTTPTAEEQTLAAMKDTNPAIGLLVNMLDLQILQL